MNFQKTYLCFCTLCCKPFSQKYYLPSCKWLFCGAVRQPFIARPCTSASEVTSNQELDKEIKSKQNQGRTAFSQNEKSALEAARLFNERERLFADFQKKKKEERRVFKLRNLGIDPYIDDKRKAAVVPLSPAAKLYLKLHAEEYAKKFPDLVNEKGNFLSLQQEEEPVPDKMKPVYPFQQNVTGSKRPVKQDIRILRESKKSVISPDSENSYDLLENGEKAEETEEYVDEIDAIEYDKIRLELIQKKAEAGKQYRDLLHKYRGTPNPNIPPSTHPCQGCGAHLHCQDTYLPGSNYC